MYIYVTVYLTNLTNASLRAVYNYYVSYWIYGQLVPRTSREQTTRTTNT